MATIAHSRSRAPSNASTGQISKTEIACRIGYAAHGVVYLLIGALAVDAAFSGGDQVAGQKGAISQLGSGTLGTILLTALAIGLLGYAYMRLWQGISDPEGHGKDAEGIAKRVGRVASGIAKIGLAFYALSLAYGWFSGATGAGGGSGESGGMATDLTASVMNMPAGRWIVGAVGVAICLAAFDQLRLAVTASFLRFLQLTADRKKWVEPLGRIAYSARFIVFLIIGGFVIFAAYQAEPGEARGLGGALRTLQEQPFGPWLLGAVGLGLVAFALLRGVYARYSILPHHRNAD